MQAASVSNPDAARLADVLAEALCTWEQHRGDDSSHHGSAPQGVDPLQQLPLLQAPHPFRFLWDGSPGLSLAASGRCHHLDLDPKSFELAGSSDATLARLIGAASAPAGPQPLLVAFTFFAHAGEQQSQPVDAIPSVRQAAARLLSRHGRQGGCASMAWRNAWCANWWKPGGCASACWL